MKTSFRSIFGISILLSLQINAQKNDIDSQLKKCLDKDYSTAGQVNCSDSARDAWDAEMNKYYQMTLKKLPKAQQSELITAQKAWLKFRDAEFTLIDNYYYNVKQGTMFQIMAAGEKVNVVKTRAKQLQVYYEVLEY
ncbi:lysozyme inhibitor LprI family protein [Soonwooa sp.]|uniref:lysozyme inhibitor LprI family protein n=1 Tax=Soonwooa sp. TaxID=1938592 RepID=UPI002604E8D4|nr:lysozyme inhibitor LprI family protein [Soonwooa sp.]